MPKRDAARAGWTTAAWRATERTRTVALLAANAAAVAATQEAVAALRAVGGPAARNRARAHLAQLRTVRERLQLDLGLLPLFAEYPQLSQHPERA